MLSFVNLTIEFDGQPIIQQFTASIEQGEFIGILGPNGAGKSTLLRSILGLVKLNAGSVLLAGQAARRGNPLIGYIPQLHQAASSQRLTGRERLLICADGHRYGLPWVSKANRRRVAALIELVQADAFADRAFTQLSGGEQQRLLLAQALLNQPRILLLDEPLASLDIKQQPHLIRLVQQIQQELSITVLLTAHDVNPLLTALHRVIYLAQGHCAIGPIHEVITSETLSALYNTPIDVIRHGDHLLVFNHEYNQQFCAGMAHHLTRESE